MSERFDQKLIKKMYLEHLCERLKIWSDLYMSADFHLLKSTFDQWNAFSAEVRVKRQQGDNHPFVF